MNRLIRTKLKSRSGASLVLAILVFLICALIGSTILTAATASGGTLTNTWKDEREVYMLRSAANVFEKSFSGKTFRSDEMTKDAQGKIVIASPTTLEDLYKALSSKVYNDGSAKETMNMTLNSASSDPTSASVSMDGAYNVTAVFSSPNTARKVTVTIQAAGSDVSTVSWLTPVITYQ